MLGSVKIALGTGLALIAIAIIVVFSQSPLTLAGTNSVPAKVDMELEKGDVSACQPARAIPGGTTAIRLAIEARAVGPMVSVRVISGSHLITEGRQVAGWGSASTVTVPIKRLANSVETARVCTTVGPTVEPFRFYGTEVRSSEAGANQLGGLELRMEYLHPGSKSWFSLASSVAHHMGLGRAAPGTWIVFLAIALMIVIAVLASWLTLEEMR